MKFKLLCPFGRCNPIFIGMLLIGIILTNLGLNPADLFAQAAHSASPDLSLASSLIAASSVATHVVSAPPRLILYVAQAREDEIHSWDILPQLSMLDAESITIEIINQPSHGGLLIQEETIAVYVPEENYFGEDTALIWAKDGAQAEAKLSVTFEIAPINDPPTPNQDIAQAQEDTPKTIDVLANDTDIDGDPLSLVTATAGHGNAAIVDNQIEYAPSVNFFGSDIITYAVTDGQASMATVVNLTVMPTDDPPFTLDDRVTASTDETVEVDVLKNDTDVDGDTLQVINISDVVSGTAEIAFGGTAVYFTPEPNAVGMAQFRYEVTDGNSTDDSTVTITLLPRDDNRLIFKPRLYLPIVR